MKQIASLPKKTISFFQRHFYLTLGLFVGIWLLASSPDKPIHYYEDMARGGHVAEFAMMADSMETASAPSMMKMARRAGNMIMPEANADFIPDEDQKLVKNASLTIEVSDTESTKVSVENKVKELNGRITNANSWETRPGVLSYSMTIRVPVESLDIATTDISALGQKKSENYSVQDITAQYTDNEARIANLSARRDRLRTMMDRETENLSDVLQIDRELSSVQQQIETLERTQRRNDNNVAYSTLNLQIQPEPQIGDIENPEWTPTRSWKKAVNELIGSLQNIADRAISIVVYAPIWIPIFLILWFIKRKFFR